MKFLPALIFVAAGIWLSYNRPDLTGQVIDYINLAVYYVITFFKSLKEGV